MTRPAVFHLHNSIRSLILATTVVAAAVAPAAVQPAFGGGGPIDRLWAPADFQSLDEVIADVVAAPVPTTAAGSFDAPPVRSDPSLRDVITRNEIRFRIPPYGGPVTGAAILGLWTRWSGDALCNTTTKTVFDLAGSYDPASQAVTGAFEPATTNEILPGCQLEHVTFTDRFHPGTMSATVDVQTGLVRGSLGRGFDFTAATDPAQLAGPVPAPLRLRRARVGSRGRLAWVALTFAEPWPPQTPIDDMVVGVVFPTETGTATAGFRVEGGRTLYFSGSSDSLAWFSTAAGSLIGVAELAGGISPDIPPTVVVYGREGQSISEVRRYTAEDVPMLTGLVGNPLGVLDEVPTVDMTRLGAFWTDGTVLTDADLNPPPPTTVAVAPSPPAEGSGLDWRWPVIAGAVVAAAAVIAIWLRLRRTRRS